MILDAREVDTDFTMDDVLAWRQDLGAEDIVFSSAGRDHLYELVQAGTPKSRPGKFHIPIDGKGRWTSVRVHDAKP